MKGVCLVGSCNNAVTADTHFLWLLQSCPGQKLIEFNMFSPCTIYSFFLLVVAACA